MSSFESDRYQWRETYFVLFRSSKRPTMAQMESTLHRLGDHYQLTDKQADERGFFESLTLVSPDDFAALDVSYLAGEEVLEQVAALADEMRPVETSDAKKLAE